MVQKKINDFTLASNIASNMQLETDIGGATANKINITQLTSYFGSNITYFSPQNIIYVAKNGNDSTGNGSFDKPFLTIGAANAAITGASTSNRFLVYIFSGTYAESTNLKAKAWTYYHGQGHSTRITSANNLWEIDLTDTNWNNSARGAIRDVTLSGSTGISFDFTSLSSSSAVIDIFDITANGGLTLSGRPSGADTIQMYNSYFLGAIAINNFQGFAKNSFGNSTFTFAASTASVTMDMQSFVYGATTVTSSGGFTPTFNVSASQISSTLTLDGADVVANIDAVSLPASSSISILNGATLNKLTPSSSINYLQATAALDFGLVAANSTEDLTIAVTGAVVGDVVALGSPSVASGISFSAFVSAADTVTVRASNATLGDITLSSENFTVKII